MPLAAAVPKAQTLPPSPEGVSLLARLPAVLPLSSATLSASATATGRSLTLVTLMATVSLSVNGTPEASVDSTVRVSAPLKFRLPK